VKWERRRRNFKRLLLFWDVTGHRLVVGYWCLGQPIGSTFRGQRAKDGTNRLSQNVCNQLLTYAT
jgi:hypothetical protein